MNEDKGINAIMNCDEYHLPIKQKEPTKLCEKIIENISSVSKEWGCSKEEVEDIFGYINGFREPVCGLFANNIMKLFLDNDEEAFNKKKHNPISELPSILNTLPENKNFILRIQDKALGHSYVIDIPSGKNNSRQCFLYQTDLGEGATRQVSAVEWMQVERTEAFLIQEFVSYINDMSNNIVKPDTIAKIFDITRSPKLLQIERVNQSKFHESEFLLEEYIEHNVLSNIENIISKMNNITK